MIMQHFFHQKIRIHNKYRYLLGLLIATCYMHVLTSCGTFVHGTSTKVTIETDQITDDSVNIVVIGPKKSVEYKNVSLPFTMKVKHHNLPLRVSMSSNEDMYEPFTIKAVRKGELWNDVSRIFGWSSIGTGVMFGGISAGCETFDDFSGVTFGSIGVGVGLMALGKFAETDIPENKIYLTSSTLYNNNESWYIRFKDIQDIYNLLQEENYLLAEAKSRWLIEQEASGELYYLKGISNYYLGEHKQALEDLKKALYLVAPEANPGLRTEIIECIESTEAAQRIKKERRLQLWSNIAYGVLEAGATTYQIYAQNEYYKDLKNYGITTSGVVTDPTKLSKAQLNQLSDPRFAAQQVMQKEYMEYQEFCRFNKKEDGSNYSFQEFQAFKGEALMRLKEEEGIDLVAEQRDMNRQFNQEWRAELEQDKKDRLEKAKAIMRGEAYKGTSSSTKTTTPTTPIASSSVLKTTTNNTTTNNNKQEEKLDSKEQFKREPVSSETYTKVKYVTLYRRDGDKAKVVMNNVELCKKGAFYYIRIGNTYYPRRSSNWLKFRNAIAYAHTQLYYND